jgi:probable rRNA maturation factor
VICLDIALENAEKIGQSLDREVCFLLVHGVLHLCGHDHEWEEDEVLMLEDQRKVMDSFNRDLPVWKDCVRILENN